MRSKISVWKHCMRSVHNVGTFNSSLPISVWQEEDEKRGREIGVCDLITWKVTRYFPHMVRNPKDQATPSSVSDEHDSVCILVACKWSCSTNIWWKLDELVNGGESQQFISRRKHRSIALLMRSLRRVRVHSLSDEWCHHWVMFGRKVV